MIVAVLEHLLSDTDDFVIINTDLLDETDAEQKEYREAVLAGVECSRTKQPADVSSAEWRAWKETYDRTRTGDNVAYAYRSEEWAHAVVKPPCHLDAVAEIWEGSD